MSGTRVFLASWVAPVESPPIRDGFVAVRDGRIASVGSARERPGEAEEIDLGPGVLMPGFVNAHTHLELSHLGGAVPGARGFVPWVEEQLRLRAEAGTAGVAAAVASAIESLEARGTCAVVDVTNTLATVEPLARSNLRALVVHEVLGWDPAKADAVIATTGAQRRTAQERLDGSRVRVAVAAHAPHSVSPALAERLVATGELRAVHLAESPAERDFLRDGSGPWQAFLEARVGRIPFDPPRASPVEYAKNLGLLRPGVLAAHCVHVDARDAATLRGSGVAAVLCPRSNEYLGNGVPPVETLLGAGVPIALGTDSLASCPSLDVLDDARWLARRFPRVANDVWVDALTRGSARAAGFEGLGALVPGAHAAMAFVAASSAPAEPFEFVLRDGATPRGVGFAP